MTDTGDNNVGNGSDEVPVGGDLRAATLASAARRKAAAADQEIQEAVDQQAARAIVAPDKSGNTKWAQPAKRLRDDSVWHGYSYVGAYATVSYCGIEHIGPKRSDAPPRGDSVCEKCAAACGFVRRSARRVHGRQRGSRRLGNLVERMEVAVDRSEEIVERMDQILGAVYMGGAEGGDS